MATPKFGLFILVMMTSLSQQIVNSTGYYGYKSYKPMKAQHWGKYKNTKMQTPIPWEPHSGWYPKYNNYNQKAPYNFKPIPFTSLPSSKPYAGYVSFQGPSYMSQKSYQKTYFFPKRNPKYLWLDFPNPPPAEYSKDIKVKKDKPSDQKVPVDTVVELPKDDAKVQKPPEINVVTLQPRIGIENAEGVGLDLYPKPETINSGVIISKDTTGNTPTGGVNDVITPGGSVVDNVNSVPIQLNKIQLLSNDVTVDLGNLPGSDISSANLQGNSNGLGDIRFGGNSLGMVPGGAAMDNPLQRVGSLIGDLIGAGDLLGNSAGIGSLGADAILMDNMQGFGGLIGNLPGDATIVHNFGGGNVLAIDSDGLQTFDSGLRQGGVVTSVSPVLDGRLGLTDSSLVDNSDFSRSFDIDANIHTHIDVERSIPSILSLNDQHSGTLSSVGFDSTTSGDSKDDISGGSQQVEILVSSSDGDGGRKIHQPLARPLSLMLTVEPFGPGPYGSCRAPAKVVCGARHGWEHVVGMASWCEKNCVVYMYTSYCDDDRCECECT